MTLPTETPGQVSGAVLLYRTPEPLSPEAHGGLSMKRTPNPYKFAVSAHALPLQVTEFGPAAINYPIIFAGEERQPMAIMSIRQNENLFINEEGFFVPDAYVPAFLRRYPFVLADDPDNRRMIVCIDTGAEQLVRDGDVPLFVDGKATDFTESAIEFCTNFETERQRTESFVQLAKELDLFELKEATFTPANPDGTPAAPIKLADYFTISEEKLKTLSGDKLVELRNSGALAQMYAQMTSLFCWDKLVARTLVRDNPPQTGLLN